MALPTCCWYDDAWEVNDGDDDDDDDDDDDSCGFGACWPLLGWETNLCEVPLNQWRLSFFSDDIDDDDDDDDEILESDQHMKDGASQL